MGEPAIRAEGLGYSYPGGGPVIEGLSLELGKGSLLAVLGANGSGKSTLLDLLAGLREPTSGKLEILPGGGECRLLPQNVDYFLLGQTVGEEIGLSLAGLDKDARAKEEERLASRWGFLGRLQEPVDSLSGGEKKRLAILGALSGKPRALFLDEPFSGLDWEGSLALAGSLASLREAGETVVLATHEPGLVKGFADVWLLLSRDRGHRLTSDQGELAGLLAEYKLRPL